MAIRTSNVEALHRQMDNGRQGSELHAVIKARQWSGAASLINGAHFRPGSLSAHLTTPRR